MQKIIIGFSTPKAWFNPFSWLIRWVGNCPMSHAYVKYTDPYTNSVIIFQASGRQVNMVDGDRFAAVEKIIAEFEIDISDDLMQRTLTKADKMLGVPYGVKHIFGIGIVVLARAVGKKIKNPFADGEATMVCSELATYVVNEIVPQQDELDPETAMPIDLFNYLKVLLGRVNNAFQMKQLVG